MAKSTSVNKICIRKSVITAHKDCFSFDFCAENVSISRTVGFSVVAQVTDLFSTLDLAESKPLCL